MEKFVVTATLRTPVIRNGYMTLDALLMAELQTGDVSNLIKQVDDLYYASAAFLDNDVGGIKASFVASMRPELTPEWLDVIAPNSNKNTDVAIGDSRYREAGNVINSYEARVASSVVWYANGDKDAVLAVLRDVKFIGKRRASGYGEVIRWEAEDGELDGLVGYLNDPLRPVPADRWTEGGDQIAIDTAWKPPYWAIENRARCYAPEVT
jgi:hypothetical protein